MLRNIPPSDIDSSYTGRHGEAFIDGHGVGDTIACIEDDAGGAAGCVEGENGLDGGVEGGDVECFEKDLGSCVAVCAGVERGFCQEDWVLS